MISVHETAGNFDLGHLKKLRIAGRWSKQSRLCGSILYKRAIYFSRFILSRALSLLYAAIHACDAHPRATFVALAFQIAREL